MVQIGIHQFHELLAVALGRDRLDGLDGSQCVVAALGQLHQIGLQGAGDGAAAFRKTQILQRTCGGAVEWHDDRAHDALDHPELGGQCLERQAFDAAVSEQRQQLVAVELIRTFLPVQLLEIGMHRVQAQQVVCVVAVDFAEHLRELFQLGRRRPIGVGHAEHQHFAGVHGAATFPVASPCGLGDGIQPGFGAQHGGEVHVHTRFDQRGGHQPTRTTGAQLCAHLRQHLTPMFGAHQRGEMTGPGTVGDALEQRTRVAAVVDDAQHLVAVAQLRCKRIIVERTEVARGDPLQLAVQRRRIGRQLAHARQPGGKTVGRMQCGLGGGAQHDAGAIVQGQFVQRHHAGLQQMQRQGLGFVQNHHAAGDVVQFPAARGAVRKQTLEKLHGRGDYDRRIPVFHGDAQFFLGLGVARAVVDEGAVMLQDGGVAEIRERMAKHLRGLLDDAGVGNHIDDPAQAVRDGVIQRERQRRQRLAAAGRHRQRKQTGLQAGLRAHMGEDIGAHPVDVAVRAEGGKRAVEPVAQLLQRWRRSELQRISADASIERVGVQIIRIHQG